MVQHLVDGSITFPSVSISLGIDSCWSFAFFLTLLSGAFYGLLSCEAQIVQAIYFVIAPSRYLRAQVSPSPGAHALPIIPLLMSLNRHSSVELSHALVACTVLAFP